MAYDMATLNWLNSCWMMVFFPRRSTMAAAGMQHLTFNYEENVGLSQRSSLDLGFFTFNTWISGPFYLEDVC